MTEPRGSRGYGSRGRSVCGYGVSCRASICTKPAIFR
ncbi:MAG: hypothetical protein JWN05_3299, partial [Arthrobacter sp.]|nr:hypothetical protein [Arthrobacter sp.]